MFKERYRQAMLRIAKLLAKPETLELSKKFYDLSKKTPDVPKSEVKLFVAMIQNAEVTKDEIVCQNVHEYLTTFLDPERVAKIRRDEKRLSEIEREWAEAYYPTVLAC